MITNLPRVDIDVTPISRMSTGCSRCVHKRWRIAVLLPAVLSRQLTATSKIVALGCVLQISASQLQRIHGKASITH